MSTPPTPEEAVPPGTVLLGKYRVDALLGKGGMGVVAEATHLALGEKVAIKFLRPDVVADDETCARFLREAQASVRLKSEHVARVSDVGLLDGGAPYMVMEFLEGVDLDQMVAASGPVAPPLAVEFVLQACEALAEAHAHGIVHRDVKPSNFFVTWRADGSPLVKVLDFGISKTPVGAGPGDLSLTQTQSMLGTPAYMSPEQMRSARSVDPRTDIWSLGAVLYELIEGRRPFEAESFSEMCVKVAADPPTPMRVALEPRLEAAVMRCLEKDPAKRFQTVAELAEVLAPYARDLREGAAHADRIRRTLARPRTRNEELGASFAGVSMNAARQVLGGGGIGTPPPGALAPVVVGAGAGPVMTTPWPTSTINAGPPASMPRSRRGLGLALALGGLLAAGVVVGVLASRGGGSEDVPAAAKPVVAADATPAVVTSPIDAGVAPAAAALDAGVEPAPEVVVDEEPAAAEPTPKRKPARKPGKKDGGAARPAATSPTRSDDVFGKRK